MYSTDNMKESNKIPTGKVQRASKFVKTGAKIGRNYVKHYAKKAFKDNSDDTLLHSDNANEIFESLSQLKGGPLKIMQMMSLNQGILPEAYQERFVQAQYSAPPLSYPLVSKTFNDQLGSRPDQIYDKFSKRAVNAASIGQVHEAYINGQKLAVKVQYPGVAESMESDLKMVKPFAKLLFKISDSDIDYYMTEVQLRLLEETDYNLEVQRSMEISRLCKPLKNIHFPKYYPEFSSSRIITMDWIEGFHLDEFIATNPSQKLRDQIGQALWDFYDYQIHVLKMMHADAHPGNYFFHSDGTLGVIDFGCVKVIPEDFYNQYFRIYDSEIASDPREFEHWLYDLKYIYDSDTPHEKKFYTDLFSEMISHLGKPFHSDVFDFGNDEYFTRIYEIAKRLSGSKELRNSKVARGIRDVIYINRTYFGLFHILNTLKARITTKSNTFALAS